MASSSADSEDLNMAIADWDTQLAVLKAFYNEDQIVVKYMDDEDELVGIKNRSDYEYALQIASATTNGVLQIVISSQNGTFLDKTKLKVDQRLFNAPDSKKSISPISKKFENIVDKINNDETLKETMTQTLSKKDCPLTSEQKEWLEEYLNKFKNDLIKDVKDMVLSELKSNDKTLSVDKGFTDFESMTLEEKVKKLMMSLQSARSIGAALRSAFFEEELLATGAFAAVFVKDCNMPDGSKCEANMKFKKTWQLKNTGKLEWNSTDFQVKLVSIAGNIGIENDEFQVVVENTKPDETTSVSVDLVAPSYPGNYFSEWVLCCNNFQFGPRIWCTINVVDLLSDDTSSVKSELESVPRFRTGSIKLEDIKQNKINRLSLTNRFSDNDTILNDSLASRHFIDDLDDEFVVVPDCFDLTKKWKSPRDESEVQTKDQSNQQENSFLNLTSSYMDNTANKTHTLVSNQDLIMLESQENKEEPLSETSTDTIEQIPEEKPTTSKNSDSSEKKEPQSSISLIPLVPATKIEDKNQKFTENESNTSSPVKTESTFDKMKNAFSNLGHPSYVGPIDLPNEMKILPLIEPKKETNMDKLISMGFANRSLNDRLLKKFNNDIDKVVQKLLEVNDNDWSDRR